MNIICGKQNLLDAVLIAERVSGKKESLPVLSCAVFTVEKKNLTIKATNLEVAVDIHVPAQVDVDGKVAVPAHILTQTLRGINGDQLSIVVTEKTLTIKSKNSTTTLNTIPTEEFPSIPRPKNKESITIPTQTLIQGISSVVYAAAQSTIRPEFSSILIRSTIDEILFVATDSFRLAEKRFSLPHTRFEDILIPTKNALELVHVLTESKEESVSFIVDDGQLSIETSTISFVTRITDATFPNYQPIVPTVFKTTTTALKADVVQVLRKARVFSHTNQQVGFQIYPSKKVFSVQAQHQDIGEMNELVDAALEGDDLEINFNITYLGDCFPSIQGDSVVLRFAGPARPLVIQSVSDKGFMYLAMPLNR